MGDMSVCDQLVSYEYGRAHILVKRTEEHSAVSPSCDNLGART